MQHSNTSLPLQRRAIRTLVSDVLSLEQVPSGLRRYGRSKGVEQAVALPSLTPNKS